MVRRPILNLALKLALTLVLVGPLSSPVGAQEIWITPVDGGGSLAVSSARLYWSTGVCSGSEFQLCRIEGTPAGYQAYGSPWVSFDNTVGSPGFNIASNVAIEGSRTYWLSEGGDVLARLGSGSPGMPEVVATMANANAFGEIAVDASYVYWLENVGEEGRLYRAPLAGGFRELMAESLDSPARDLQVDRTGRAYFLADKSFILCCVDVLHQVAPDGAGGFSTSLSARSYMDGYTLSTNQVWAASRLSPGADLTIARADLSGISASGDWTHLYTASPVGDPEITEMALTQDDLYWYERDIGSSRPILRMPRAGGSAEAVSFALPEVKDLKSSAGTYHQSLFFLNEGTVYRLPANASPRLRDIVADEITLEVTQAVQDPAHTVPLVERKRTFVRAYARLGSDSFGAPGIFMSPSMGLYGTRGGLPLTGSPLRPFGGSDVIYDSAVDRASADNQILFELPESWASGTISLTATVDPNNVVFETDETNNSTSRTVSFDATGGICIDIIPVLSTNGAERGGTRDLRSRTFARAESLLPTADLFWIKRAGSPKSKPVTGDPYNFGEGDDTNELLYHWWHDFLFASDPPQCNGQRTIRTAVVGNAANFGKSSFASPAIFYLQVEGGVPENAPRGGPSGLAHEVGHQLGQLHIGCPYSGMDNAPAFPDGSYPYDSCAIEDDNLDHLGFDVLTQKLIVPFDGDDVSQSTDYMSYGGPYWASDWVYRRHFAELQNDSPSPPVAGSGPLLVAGSVRDDGSVEFASAFELDAPGLARAQIALGEGTVASADYRVQLYDGSGSLQIDEALRVAEMIPEEEGDPGFTTFFGLVPAQTNIAEIRLVDGTGSSVLGAASFGVNPPSVSITSPALASTLNDPVTLSWTGIDPDADPLEYRTLFTADGGVNWVDLARTRTSSVSVPLTDLPTGTQVFFKVLASDGLRSTEDIVGPFVIPNRAPDIALFLDDYSASPAQVSVPFDAPYSLRAEARDSDDGRIDATNLVWTVTGPASLSGTGEQLSLQGLPPGDYLVEAAATDSGGLNTSESVQLTVESKGIATSNPPEFDGRCDDVAYAADPSPIAMRYANGQLVEIVLIQAGGDVFMCASGMRAGLATDVFEMRIDANGSADASMQADDRYVRVTQDGSFEIGVGDGAGGDQLDPTNISVDALSWVEGQVWEAEFRLAAHLVGSDAGIAFRHVESAGSGADWPAGFGPFSPATWGGAVQGSLSTGPLRLIGWEGALQILTTDTGQGVFTGGIVGESIFDGYFVYPHTCSADCMASTSAPTETTYTFPTATGFVRGVGAGAGATENHVLIVSDYIVDANFVTVAGQLGLSLQVGQQIDGWQISSQSGPEGSPGLVKARLIYIYASSDPFDHTEYTPDPPPFADLVTFSIKEGDPAGLYEVFGLPTTVPEPAFGLGIGVALLMIFGLRGRSRPRSAIELNSKC